MLMPKKVKFRKQQKGKMRGKAWVGSAVSFGDYGLKALECGYITDRQIEAGRIAISRYLKRNGPHLDPHVPRQARHQEAAGNQNGQGQGRSGSLVVVVIKPGRILYEMEGCPEPRRARRSGWRRTSSTSRRSFVKRFEAEG
jgi:large subunit ribosomal protein L16